MNPRPHPLPRRRLLAGTLAALTAASLTACGGGNSVADQAKAGDRKGYVGGDGTIRQIAPDERKEPVTLAGDTLDGDTWDIADHRGSVVVVNLWASWCGPCEKEAPELVEAHQAYRDKGVEFIGIDYREPSLDTGKAQSEAWGLTYPSIFDDTGTTSIGMQGTLSAQPSTAVVDREGRVAAVVLGATTRSTLTGLIDDVLAEG